MEILFLNGTPPLLDIQLRFDDKVVVRDTPLLLFIVQRNWGSYVVVDCSCFIRCSERVFILDLHFQIF